MYVCDIHIDQYQPLINLMCGISIDVENRLGATAAGN